jgi:Zinc-ribbon containing domain
VSPRLKNRDMDDAAFVVGQLAGPGTYRCESCGLQWTEHALSFEIEQCECGGTAFRRVD